MNRFDQKVHSILRNVLHEVILDVIPEVSLSVGTVRLIGLAVLAPIHEATVLIRPGDVPLEITKTVRQIGAVGTLVLFQER